MARLKISLPQNWNDVSKENPKGPPTFCRASDGCGALQISLQAEYKGGEIPNPKLEDLIEFANNIAQKFGEVQVRGRASGTCALGTYGTVLVATPELAWAQVWVLSNSKDFVLATHICESEPSEDEVNEASGIVKHVTLK